MAANVAALTPSVHGHMSLKKVRQFFWSDLRQTSTDFQSSFTETLHSEFAVN